MICRGTLRLAATEEIVITRHGKPAPSSRKAAPTQGRADLALSAFHRAEIARTSPADLRDLPDDFRREARVVMPVTRQAISIGLGSDAIACFRATGARYQSRINDVPRVYVDRVR